MFPWSTLHVMNEYIDNVCISEDDINIPKENVSPPLLLLYPKIHPILVPGIIRYVNTLHFIILFVDAVHS